MTKYRTFHCSLVVAAGLVTLLTLLGMIAALPAQADPDIRYVSAMLGSDAGNACAAVSTPCQTIQHAIDVAQPGDEIRVAGGTYSNTGTVAVITKTLSLLGGYAPDFGDFVPGQYPTTLDALGAGSVVNIITASDVILTNLILTGGDGTHNCGDQGCGGGFYISNSSVHIASTTITHNVGSHNGAGYGGGIYADHSTVTLVQNNILSNTGSLDTLATTWPGGAGGGVYITDGNAFLIENYLFDNIGGRTAAGNQGGGIALHYVTYAEVVDNRIQNNIASLKYGGDGGGLWIFHSTFVQLVGNRIENNWTNPTVAGYGAGIYILHTSVSLSSNVIAHNTALAPGTGWVAPGGGASIVTSIDPVTLTNNLIVDNEAGVYGGGLYLAAVSPAPAPITLINNTIADNGKTGVVLEDADVALTNNIIAGHTLGLTATFSTTLTSDYNLFWNEVDVITGGNSILADPLFTPNYHLRAGSLALDAGLAVPWLTEDLDGNPRPQNGQWDMGAFEGAWQPVFLPLVVR